MSHELITGAFGNFGTLVAAHWINGTTRYDEEHGAVYMETRRSRGPGSRPPRLVMLDHQHPTRIAKELDISKAAAADASDPSQSSGSPNYHQDPAVFFGDQGEDEDDATYANRMFADAGDDDDSLFYGGAAVARRVRAGARGEESEKAETSGTAADAAECEPLPPIFSLRQSIVPWWRYIAPPLHRTAYSLLRSAHTDPRGVALLHSFGHGMLRSTCAAPEIETTWESLRFQLEDADACQGFQLFADADGALGGIALATIRHIRDELDADIPIAAHALFPPFYVSPGDECGRQRADELLLNRALALHTFGEEASLLVPYRIQEWAELWGCPYVDDNVCTAQVCATAIDSAFYGCRDPDNYIEGGDKATLDARTLRDYVHALRPAPCYRVVSPFAALPMALRPRSKIVNGKPQQLPPSFSEFLEDHPLLLPLPASSPSGVAAPPCVSWVPLAHGLRSDPGSPAGHVHGQVVALRGVGGLTDVACPRLEAINRHILYPTRCTRTLTTVTAQGYPLASTFPAPVLHFPAGTPLHEQLPHTPAGAHMATTSSAAPMIRDIISGAEPIMRIAARGVGTTADTYGLEGEEWLEVREGLMQLRDDYDHDVPSEDDAIE